MKILALVTACLVIVGCTTTVSSEKYYALELQAFNASEKKISSHSARWGLVAIELPEYLDQRGLAMQVGDQQIKHARQHLWAEPLSKGIARVLARDIEIIAGHQVDSEAGTWTSDINCWLRVEINKFHPTDASHVVASGSFWISQKIPRKVSKHSFTIQKNLNDDGYGHAVQQMSLILNTLATQIVKQMASVTSCNVLV
jgi:hypothetical protein